MKPANPVILSKAKDPVSFPLASIPLDSSASPQNDGCRGFVRRFVPVLLALCSLLLAPRSNSTELTDLGQGLGYLRAHSLDEVIKPLNGSNAIVLDLRHTTATPETLPQFSTALSDRPVGSRLFILVGPDTPAELSSGLKGNGVTLGIKETMPAPDVMIEQTAAADRAAYDALETGTPLAQLISGRIEKDRYDEASLVQEFKNGNHEARPPESGAPKATTAPLPLTDRVLQRAVQLHRALLALRR